MAPRQEYVLIAGKEERVAQLLAIGKSKKEITAELQLSPGAIASIMRKDLVIERVQVLRDGAAERANVNIERIVEELARIGFANMQDYMEVNDEGFPELSFDSLTRGEAAAVSEIVTEERTDENGVVTRRTKFKLHDKRAALVDLGKYLGMFTDNVNVRGSIGVVQVNITADEAAV